MKRPTKLMAGISATILATALASCGNDLPDEPTGYECDDWEWDEDTGTYYCDDEYSPHYRSYFYGGLFYSTKSALRKSAKYSTYYNSYKSGLGTGTKGGVGG